MEPQISDQVKHRLLSGYPMTILDIRPCPSNDAPEPHKSYRIRDHEGNEDWVCGNDIRLPTTEEPRG